MSKWNGVFDRLPKLKSYDLLENIDCPEDETWVIGVLDNENNDVYPLVVAYDGMFDEYGKPAEPLVYGKTIFFYLRNCGMDEGVEVVCWKYLPEKPEI